LNNRDFEQRFLDLVFRSDERLTPHLVAYRLDIPFAEAKQQLERLAKEGMVSFEMDESGNTWYEVPGVERRKRSFDDAPRAPLPPVKPAEPQPRMVSAPPRGFGVLSVVGILAAGLLIVGLVKLLFMPLLILGLLGLAVFRHRAGCHGWGRSWRRGFGTYRLMRHGRRWWY
jgi:hypothetical protein